MKKDDKSGLEDKMVTFASLLEEHEALKADYAQVLKDRLALGNALGAVEVQLEILQDAIRPIGRIIDVLLKVTRDRPQRQVEDTPEMRRDGEQSAGVEGGLCVDRKTALGILDSIDERRTTRVKLGNDILPDHEDGEAD